MAPLSETIIIKLQRLTPEEEGMGNIVDFERNFMPLIKLT